MKLNNYLIKTLQLSPSGNSHLTWEKTKSQKD